MKTIVHMAEIRETLVTPGRVHKREGGLFAPGEAGDEIGRRVAACGGDSTNRS